MKMFSYLPNEILFKIIIPLHPKDIFYLCYINKELYKLSRDEEFWKLKLKYDIPDKECFIPKLVKFYQDRAFTKLIYINISADNVRKKRITNNMLLKDILGSVSKVSYRIDLIDKNGLVLLSGCEKCNLGGKEVLRNKLLESSLKFCWNSIHTINLKYHKFMHLEFLNDMKVE
ncbi:F-box domain-containing protein [Orpheovirus IHUMI-LCC2]|uniref:F-box domain-containing protein n=1 Tax=Orpheovirus IHUMI-LCC2 TaxID=2023057 RepID=A0A2I2L448_9VIRU|nr:F-box domain-containing protein [Orpheovirus IHUMI-LCC2]SNW62303.1 F-box domain-containing protein [Orpheovirus IHUMI-LCC2]